MKVECLRAPPVEQPAIRDALIATSSKENSLTCRMWKSADSAREKHFGAIADQARRSRDQITGPRSHRACLIVLSRSYGWRLPFETWQLAIDRRPCWR